MLKWLRKNEKGQGMVEYGLILALVSIIAIGALTDVGTRVSDTFDKVMDSEFVSGKTDIGVGEPVYTKEEIDNLVSEGYIPIATADELNNLRTTTSQTFGVGTDWKGSYESGLNKNYIQVSDIDLSGITNFEPIGHMDNTFKGIYDGGGYEIKNLTVNKDASNYSGLFGRVEGATLTNIGLVDVDVKGGSQVGGLVGGQYESSKVLNSYATGSVTGGNQTGGLVGYQVNSSKVVNSYATGKVSGGWYVGGLVGFQQSSSTVSSSYATGSVTGTGSYVGGLVGYQSGPSEVVNSYYDTKTTGRADSGKGIGKTTTEMKNKDTYSGWDESIWTIESNQYPTLR